MLTFNISGARIKVIINSSEVCMKECQFCKELIKENASVCKYCKRKQRIITLDYLIEYVGCGWLALGLGLILFFIFMFSTM